MSDQQDSSAPASSPGGSSSSSSQVNVQQLKSQLANRFQPNKALVLKLHSILTWEQDVHPVLVGGLVTLSFLIIYMLNSSVLTTLSYLGIVVALVDLAMPFITKNLCGQSSASGNNQGKTTEKDNQRFDKICLDLAKAYAFVRNGLNTCCSLKTSKPKVYYPALLVSLVVLAWIGNKVNNLFITWLVTLLIALYPGLDRRGVPQRAVEFVFLKLGRRPPSFVSSGAGDRRQSGKRN